MAAMKPRTGDGPLEVTKEGRGIVMRVPLEGGGRLVVELNGSGLTILMVEQNAQQSLAVAHWAYLLETGAVVESAPSAELASKETVRDVFLGGRARAVPAAAAPADA